MATRKPTASTSAALAPHGLRVTPATAARLAKLDLYTARDLLLHLPLRYEDETQVTPISEARNGQAAQFVVTVLEAKVEARARRQLVLRVRDASAEMQVRFLHFYPTQTRELKTGVKIRLFGEPRFSFHGRELVHPRYKLYDRDALLPQHLTPVYPTTAGLTQPALRKLIYQQLDALSQRAETDHLPAAIRQRYRFPDWPTALTVLHRPARELLATLEAGEHPAQARLRFEELLAQQISLRLAYRARAAKTAVGLPPPRPQGYVHALRQSLPFQLTGAQHRAVGQIAHDLAIPHPMQRLLQGDVGSGKTIVAALAMLQAAENGFQAALMAPTEILAEQHYVKLKSWLEPLGLSVAWLSGSQKKREREAALAALSSGDTLLAVGTHALIEDPVAFPKLALVVVDEQHRFGVKQRLALRDKGAQVGGVASHPHMLMMSATPIPRTLAMSFYADLDVSVLDELPPGRTPIVTKLISATRRDEVIERVYHACQSGRQAYWVCPLIEESEALQLETALDTHAYLSEHLPGLQVGLVHGRLKSDEKSQVMDAFSRGEIHVLVATTVIEVGVDVPNASLMVIEHAERFGLAQLHQLRGRVGRGEHASACVLLYTQPLSDTGKARLRIIHQHQDGFEIARQDLLLRGPGEFIGARQSGVPLLRYADLERDAEWVEAARETAEELLSQTPEIARAIADLWLSGREGYLRA